MAAPGAGTWGGSLRALAVFALLAAAGAAPLVLALELLADRAPLAQRGLFAAFVVFLGFAWWFSSSRTRVDVAADGVSLVRHGRSRFLPVGAILGTNTSDHAVTLFLDEAMTGQRELLLASRRTRAPGDVGRWPDPEIQRLAAAIQSILEDRAPRAPRVRVAEALARGGRSVEAWAASLRALGGGGFRAGTVPRDELWRVVEDATQPASLRVAAAVALQPQADADRVRVRVQADTSAHAGFRAALEAALEGPRREEEVERHLQALVDDE